MISVTCGAVTAARRRRRITMAPHDSTPRRRRNEPEDLVISLSMHRPATARLSAFLVATLLLAASAAGATHSAPPAPHPGLPALAPEPRPVSVRSAFGGFILGYDVDRNGEEGVLAEALTLANGDHDVALETFDQRTGKIVKIVVQELGTKSDYVVLGLAGDHTVLAEYEHVTNLFVDQRLYVKLDPLSANAITGQWTPPLGTSDVIAGVTRSQGSADTVFLANQFTASGSLTRLFRSDVAANAFGPLIKLTHPHFAPDHAPVIALDDAHHRAILAALGGNPFGPPTLGKVDLATGATTTFTGIGIGYVNGLAVDSATGVACTTTEIDFRIEIYDLASQQGFQVVLPGAVSQAHSGTDVQVDAVHKLFFVGQPISSTAPSGSSVHVFDEQGGLVKSIDGLKLPASPALIALAPARRTGFVLRAPDLNTLQSFSY